MKEKIKQLIMARAFNLSGWEIDGNIEHYTADEKVVDESNVDKLVDEIYNLIGDCNEGKLI